jgi:hypothetical protein
MDSMRAQNNQKQEFLDTTIPHLLLASVLRPAPTPGRFHWRVVEIPAAGAVHRCVVVRVRPAVGVVSAAAVATLLLLLVGSATSTILGLCHGAVAAHADLGQHHTRSRLLVLPVRAHLRIHRHTASAVAPGAVTRRSTTHGVVLVSLAILRVIALIDACLPHAALSLEAVTLLEVASIVPLPVPAALQAIQGKDADIRGVVRVLVLGVGARSLPAHSHSHAAAVVVVVERGHGDRARCLVGEGRGALVGVRIVLVGSAALPAASVAAHRQRVQRSHARQVVRQGAVHAEARVRHVRVQAAQAVLALAGLSPRLLLL